MSQKVFDVVGGCFFFLIAVAHLLRAIFGVAANIGGYAIPVWWSWLAFVGIGYLAYAGLRMSRKAP